MHFFAKIFSRKVFRTVIEAIECFCVGVRKLSKNVVLFYFDIVVLMTTTMMMIMVVLVLVAFIAIAITITFIISIIFILIIICILSQLVEWYVVGPVFIAYEMAFS